MRIVLSLLLAGLTSALAARDFTGDDLLAIQSMWHEIITPHKQPAAKKKLRALLPKGARITAPEDCYLQASEDKAYLAFSCWNQKIRIYLTDAMPEILQQLQIGDKFTGTLELTNGAGGAETFAYGRKELHIYVRAESLTPLPAGLEVTVPTFLNTDKARLWELRNGEELLCVLGDNQHFISQIYRTGAFVRDVETGKLVQSLGGLGYAFDASCQHAGQIYLHTDTGIWTLNPADWSYREIIKNPAGESIKAMAISDDEKTIVYCSVVIAQPNGFCRVTIDSVLIHTLPLVAGGFIVNITKGGRWAYIRKNYPPGGMVLDTQSGSISELPKEKFEGFQQVRASISSESFDVVITKNAASEWALFTLNPGEMTLELQWQAGKNAVSSFQWANDGSKLLVYDWRRGFYERNMKSKKDSRLFTEEIRHFRNMVYLPNMRQMLTDFDDEPAITLWNLDAPAKLPVQKPEAVGEVFAVNGRAIDIIGPKTQGLPLGATVRIQAASGIKLAKVSGHFHSKVKCLVVGDGTGIAKGDKISR